MRRKRDKHIWDIFDRDDYKKLVRMTKKTPMYDQEYMDMIRSYIPDPHVQILSHYGESLPGYQEIEIVPEVAIPSRARNPNFVSRGGLRLGYSIPIDREERKKWLKLEDDSEIYAAGSIHRGYDPPDFPGFYHPISDSEFWEEMDRERRERERALYEMDRRRQQQIDWDGNEIYHRHRSLWD
jgi:hypothetical protein